MLKKFQNYNIPEENKPEFQRELIESNYIRSRNLSFLLFFIFIILLFTDYMKYRQGLWQENGGYRFLLYSHFFYVLLLFLLYGYLFVRRSYSQALTLQLKQHFVLTFSFIILLGASFTTIADQLIHGEITIYVLCIWLFAIINYQKPLSNLGMYAICHIVFLIGITFTQSSPAALSANYFNGTVLVILAVFVSRILFIAKVNDFNSKKTIEIQKSELEKKNLELSVANAELHDSLLALDESQNIIFSLTLALESKDTNTHGHSERVAQYAMAIAKHLNLNQKDMVDLWRAAILHDIGKIGIPDAILNKPSALTEEEWVIVKSHPHRGEVICSKLKFAHEILPIIRYHHERYDGKGYPDGLQGNDIPFLARIVSVADTVDAITSPRTYRPMSRTMEQAVEELKINSGTQFDPLLVEAFEKVYLANELNTISEALGDLYDIKS
ncbi:MAG: HD domain-containing protein [Peptococcaceae bacterium]|nr:HD domain-containing protein [Peptococcaceae bacterium]